MSIIAYDAFDSFYKKINDLNEKAKEEIGKCEVKQEVCKPEKELQSNTEACKKK